MEKVPVKALMMLFENFKGSPNYSLIQLISFMLLELHDVLVISIFHIFLKNIKPRLIFKLKESFLHAIIHVVYHFE